MRENNCSGGCNVRNRLTEESGWMGTVAASGNGLAVIVAGFSRKHTLRTA